MNGLMKITAISAAAMLAACEGETKTQDTSTERDVMAEKTLEKDTYESTQQVVLNTSSLQQFKTSLAFMRASLPDDDRAELTDALAKLSGTMMERAEAAVTPGTEITVDEEVAEAVYSKYGNKLDGKTFDQIIAMAG
ncbi:hypothetical protein [Kordiimonas sp.]|uniref:hypothetical protein n=1 Tax=Kordiimonas sp. TaxID=1970157 RepID=UPI003A94A8FB